VSMSNPPLPRYPAPDECQICGWYPAITATQRTVISLLLWWGVRRKTSRLCRSCGIALTRRAQANCLGFGFWGIGILGAIFVTFKNSAELRRLREALPPPQGRRSDVGTDRSIPLPQGMPVLLYIRSWLFLGPVVGGITIRIIISMMVYLSR
jgi:hypothetical protein